VVSREIAEGGSRKGVGKGQWPPVRNSQSIKSQTQGTGPLNWRRYQILNERGVERTEKLIGGGRRGAKRVGGYRKMEKGALPKKNFV